MNEQLAQMFASERSSFLPELYRWGIEVIKVIQRLESPALTAVMKFITAFGTAYLYLPLILFIFWWIDEKRGFRLGILIIVTAWINEVVKFALKQPRPFHFDPALGMAYEPTYGAPSGHAQMSICFWIAMAVWLGQILAKPDLSQIAAKRRKLMIWAGVIFFILLIGFTRLYLGVHFPTDLFAGWLLGGAIIALAFFLSPRLEKLFASGGVRLQNISAAAIVLVMNGLYPQDRSLPALFLGFCLGYAAMKQYFPFSASEAGVKVQAKIARCLIGFAGMALIYTALRLVFPGEGSLFGELPLWSEASPYYELGRFIRYALVGFWASAGPPWVIKRIRQAPDESV